MLGCGHRQDDLLDSRNTGGTIEELSQHIPAIASRRPRHVNAPDMSFVAFLEPLVANKTCGAHQLFAGKRAHNEIVAGSEDNRAATFSRVKARALRLTSQTLPVHIRALPAGFSNTRRRRSRQEIGVQLLFTNQLYFGSPASRAISANFQARYHDPEPAVFLHLPLQFFEYIADKLHYFAATQAGHVNVVAIQLTFVVVAFAVDVHQVEFVNKPLAFQQLQGAVDSAAVDAGIDLARLAQKLTGVEVLGGCFHDAENGATLLRHADSALGEVGL
jgi:hypothetical protein